MTDNSNMNEIIIEPVIKPTENSLKCSSCGLVFGILYAMRKGTQVRHFKLNIVKRDSKYLCNVCDKHIPNEEELCVKVG